MAVRSVAMRLPVSLSVRLAVCVNVCAVGFRRSLNIRGKCTSDVAVIRRDGRLAGWLGDGVKLRASICPLSIISSHTWDVLSLIHISEPTRPY